MELGETNKTRKFRTFSQLNEQESFAVRRELFSRISQSPGSDPYVVFAQVLADYGVGCEHPQERRLYSGKFRSYFPMTEHLWYSCKSCGCSVLNEDFKIQKTSALP